VRSSDPCCITNQGGVSNAIRKFNLVVVNLNHAALETGRPGFNYTIPGHLAQRSAQKQELRLLPDGITGDC
jgi:hypothetical protein